MTETIIDPEREAVRKAIEEQQAAAQKDLEAEQRAAEARRKAAEAVQRVDAVAQARYEAWAGRVVASAAKDSATGRAAVDAAWTAFEAAASIGSAELAAYLAWVRAGTEQNRLATRYRLARGDGTGHQPPFDNPAPYLMALEAAVSGATHRLLG